MFTQKKGKRETKIWDKAWMLYKLSALLKYDMNVEDFWKLQLIKHSSVAILIWNAQCKW